MILEEETPTGIKLTNDRFLLVKKPSEDEILMNRIIVVQNWLDEVARQIGTN